jgi:hypothetical protein
VSRRAARELQNERSGDANVCGSIERPRLNADRRTLDHELRDAVIEQHPVVLIF